MREGEIGEKNKELYRIILLTKGCKAFYFFFITFITLMTGVSIVRSLPIIGCKSEVVSWRRLLR